MLNIERRKKYGGLGYNISKTKNTIKLNFDLQALNLMCCYVVSQNKNIRRSHLINMRNLFEVLDMDSYINDKQKLKRINFIKRGIEARLVENLKDPYIIIKYINGGLFDDDIIDPENLQYVLSTEELNWINETISKSLKHTFMYGNVDRMIDVCTRFKAADYTTVNDIVEEFEALIDEFKTNFRRARVQSMHDMVFSLRDGFFENYVRDIHGELTNPSSRLLCGMQGLNELFGGGVENGRCYMFYGSAGTFKSGLLLTLAYQLKKYNKNIQLKDPSKRPAIVILTMENTIKETIERLFNMSTVSDDIRNFSADDVIHMLRQQGELYLNDNSPIDIIIKYQPNRSVDTGYLYTLVEELEDEGIETICVIQDYVRRIRSAYKQTDVRLELGEVINEFKVFCSIKDIPLITAGQLNREASKTIETANQANKSDLIRLLGRSNIGESSLMLDNIDWASLINIEYDSAGNMYLGFNRIKIRNRPPSSNRFIIFQPFVTGNGMKLLEDMNSPVPLFRETLKDGIEENILFNGGRSGRQTIQNRRNVEDILSEKKSNIKDDDNIFTRASRYSSINTFTEPTMPVLVTNTYQQNLIRPISYTN